MIDGSFNCLKIGFSDTPALLMYVEVVVVKRSEGPPLPPLQPLRSADL
jgi:hypothetical protein